MKAVAAVIIAAAALKRSYAQTLTLPDCGAVCIVNAVAVTTCSASDFSCLCTNTDFIDLAVHCINDTCDSSDAQEAYTYAEYACSSVGVTVPSVSSVLATPDTYEGTSSSSSSSPAPAPADPPASAPASPPAAPASSSSSSSDDSASPAAAPAPAPADPSSSSSSSSSSSDTSDADPASADPSSSDPSTSTTSSTADSTAAAGTTASPSAVTFQGSSASAIGIQRGYIAAAVLGVVAIVGAGLL